MTAKNISLFLLVGFAAFATVSTERRLLHIMLDLVEGIVPCSQACLLENYDAYIEAFKDTGCDTRLTTAIQRLNQPSEGLGGMDRLLRDPTPICGLLDEMDQCAVRLVGRFCGNDMADYMRKNMMNPVKAYLNCDKQKDNTLLQCLAISQSASAHLRCVGAANVTVVSRLGKDIESLTRWYSEYLSNPNAELCPIARNFVTCEKRELKAANPSVCTDNVLKNLDNEATDIVDFFLCNTSKTMDALQCLTNPQLYNRLSNDCAKPMAAAIERISKTTKPEDLQSALTKAFLSKEGLMKDFLECVKKDINSSPNCEKDGWSIKLANNILDPILGVYENNPRRIEQCTDRFRDFPDLNGVSRVSAVPWFQLILLSSLMILLLRRDW